LKPSDLFYGSRQKIKRANKHIVDLDEGFVNFIDSDFCSLGLQEDPNTGEYYLECAAKPMPESVPLVLGDAIHNLRTSLDLAVSEITRRAKQSVAHVKFPFRETREEVIAAINGGFIKAAPASVISVIVDQIKPYKGGNDPLCSLHALDVKDKHHLIVPTISIVRLDGVSLVLHKTMVMKNCSYIVEAGYKIRLAVGRVTPVDLDIQDKGKPTAEIQFRQGEPFETESVIRTLHQLSDLVTGCIDAIEEAYLSSF